MRRASNRISFVTTVFNEEKTINRLLASLFRQSNKSDEIIVVDGGSTDNTVTRIQNAKFKVQNYKSKFKIIIKKGNRAVGRNEGIKQAKGDIILLSDAGCTLERNWVKNISEPFYDTTVDVVAGYYKAKPKTIFQKCLIPYVFVMPDQIKKDTFLPATRSMAFRKHVWERIGGFSEQFSHNEDYVFARKLIRKKINIQFNQKAVVYWEPRRTFIQAFIMFFRFAFGDAEAQIFRPKVLIMIARYLVGFVFIYYLSLSFSLYIFSVLVLFFSLYFLWAILKNYRYVRDIRATLMLPSLQMLSDIAVISGTIAGLVSLSWGVKRKK